MMKTTRSSKPPEIFYSLPSSADAGRVRQFDGASLIPYDEAYRVLATALSADVGKYPASLRSELPAIVTHWLQSTADAPVMLGAAEGARWRLILSAYATLTLRLKPNMRHQPIVIDFSSLPFAPKSKPDFDFIDLFAGIGGFRLALQAQGGKCVFTSEWDKHAKNTYAKNYGEVPFGDITQFTEPRDSVGSNFASAIPSHAILAAGFPCQAFSQAGHQLGFDDARGTLFFEILKIAQKLKPEVLFLENVKRLRSHDGGKTFKVIINSLHELGYKVYAKVLRAYDFGVPQNRERLFIVAFKKPIYFEFPNPPKSRLYENVGSILEKRVDNYYTISDKLYSGHKRRHREHRLKGNGFGFSEYTSSSLSTNTLSARYWKDGSEILITQKGANPRMLTLRECARLQGYPDQFIPHDSHAQGYKQFGNSVSVPVVSAIAEAIIFWRKRSQPAISMFDAFEPVLF